MVANLRHVADSAIAILTTRTLGLNADDVAVLADDEGKMQLTRGWDGKGSWRT